MVALGGSILGLIILVFGVSTFSAGLNPTTLALIGLPLGAAVHSIQESQDLREERIYEMHENEIEAEELTEYSPDLIEEDGAIEVRETLPGLQNCPQIESFLGTWEYKRITKNGKDVATLNSNDTMLIAGRYSDTTAFEFKYDIEMLNKHSKGVVNLVEQDQNCAFVFVYFAPDGISFSEARTFKISHFDGDSLRLTEGPLAFEYRKK